MLSDRIFESRVDRLIATSRAALGGFSLIAIWLDPSQPTKYAGITYLLLAIYATYANTVAVGMWRWNLQGRHWGVATQIVDLAVFAVLVCLTDGPTSPFYLLFTFSLLSATLKWRWQGALWTSLVVIALFTAAGFVFRQSALTDDFELNRFVIRGTHIAIIGAMLVYFGIHQERIGREMLKLAAWPQGPVAEPGLAVQQSIEYAAGVFGAPRVLCLWSDPDEPWLFAEHWRNGTFQQVRLPPGQFDPPVAEALADETFLYESGRGVLFYSEAGKLVSWRGSALHPALRERYCIGSALSLHVETDAVEARLFILDKSDFAPEDLTIGRVVAAQIAIGLERAALLVAWRDTAAAEERIRLARDLHDGILQSLAGTALQLQGLLQTAETNPDELRSRILGLQEGLASEQRELRAFIRQLRPETQRPDAGDITLKPELEQLAQQLQRQWGLTIDLTVDPPNASVPARLRYDLRQIIREGTANAARHGEASRIGLAVRLAEGHLRIRLEDDGRGFSLHGQFDEARLAKLGIGPRSLRERIAGLRGSLLLESNRAGTRLAMNIPLTQA